MCAVFNQGVGLHYPRAFYRAIPVCVGLLLVAQFSQAERVSHGAHAHGSAELTVAVEGSALEVELRAPAADIVGFEYPAKSAAERESVRAAEARLLDAAALFAFSGTQCTLQSATADLSAVEPVGAPEEHHGEHHGDEEVAHAGHDTDHSHDHGDEHRAHATHSDITALYRYRCADTAALAAIEVIFGGALGSIAALNAMFVTQNASGAVELTGDRRTITLGN